MDRELLADFLKHKVQVGASKGIKTWAVGGRHRPVAQTPFPAEVPQLRPLGPRLSPKDTPGPRSPSSRGSPHPAASVHGVWRPSHFPQLDNPRGHLSGGLCPMHVTATPSAPSCIQTVLNWLTTLPWETHTHTHTDTSSRLGGTNPRWLPAQTVWAKMLISAGCCCFHLFSMFFLLSKGTPFQPWAPILATSRCHPQRPPGPPRKGKALTSQNCLIRAFVLFIFCKEPQREIIFPLQSWIGNYTALSWINLRGRVLSFHLWFPLGPAE